MKSILLPLLAVAAFIALVGLFTQRVSRGNFILTSAPPKSEIKVGSTTVLAATADSEEERKEGLSGQSSLPENEGMLFVFDQKDIFPSFWMRDMLIPVDILWINDDKLVKIDKNVQPPQKDTPDASLPLYRPDKPIDYVLEVNAGFSDKNGLKEGDGVELGL